MSSTWNVAGQRDPSLDAGRFVALRNGAAIRVRPIRPDDALGLIALCGRLSPRTICQRFFTFRRLRREDVAALCSVDGHEQMAMVAERDIGPRTELVGVARYSLAGEDLTPEVGLVVEDAWQGLGLGPVLLTKIMRGESGKGSQRFTRSVLAENDRMLRLITRYADIIQRTVDHGIITVVFRRHEV